MSRRSLLKLPFDSLIEKYDYYIEGKVNFCVYKKKDGRYYNIRLIKNNKMVLSISKNTDLIIWDLETNTLDKILKGDKEEIHLTEVLNDNRIISLYQNNLIRIWDINTGLYKKILYDHVDDIIIYRNNCIINVNNTEIHIWNPDTEKIERIIPETLEIILCMDNKIIGMADCYLKIIDLQSGKLIRSFEGHTKNIENLHIFDSERIISSSYDNTIRIWNIITGICENIIETKGIELLLVFSDKTIITTWYSTIRIWKDYKNIQNLEGCTGKITILKILPDERLISVDGSVIRIWNLDSLKCEQVFCNKYIIKSLYTLEDGRIITCDAHSIRVWK